MNMEGQQKFGLLLKKKTGKYEKSKSIFDSSSDEEKQVKKEKPKIPQFKSSSKFPKTETEDPSIYEYDAVYDDMKAKEKAELLPKQKKESRYIGSLLKAADKRKKQYQIRVEKKVQVEREKEGDKFKDKEAFVTSSYKKKMQEMEEEEERERRENMMNEMMDVTKQKDLSGFYRHFLKQTVGEEKVPTFGDKDLIKKEPLSDTDSVNVDKNDQSKNSAKNLSNPDADYSSEKNESLGSEDESKNHKEKYSSKKKNKFYSSDDSDSRQEQNERKRIKREKNVDPDKEVCTSDTFAGASVERFRSKPNKHSVATKESEKVLQKENEKVVHVSSDDDACSEKSKQSSKAAEKKKYVEETVHSSTKSSDDDACIYKSKESELKRNSKKYAKETVHSSHNSSDDDEVSSEREEVKLAKNSETVDEKNLQTEQSREIKLRSLYQKRTVGAVFDEAQARYFMRLSSRNS